ncbi:hypothetical protein HAX54_013261 [Datura stramonium]|uniref:Pentatricopeptide repeat-containing protein n=1 Tax=Datura stramonium TaxID=4076 RepID=A0ABS8TL18_DATST|nr:hypothetical protein [Datura stramonium]
MSYAMLIMKLPREALITFREMGLNRVRPNPVTLSSVLPACSDLKSLNLGREIHGYIVRNGIHDNVYVSSALVDIHSQLVDEGLMIFYSMRKEHGVEPDSEHYSCMVDALSRAGRLEQAYNFIQNNAPWPSAGGREHCLVHVEYIRAWKWHELLENSCWRLSQKMLGTMFVSNIYGKLPNYGRRPQKLGN